MKLSQEELKGRINTCLEYFSPALDKNNRELQNDFQGLSRILEQMSRYLAEFNFYPSEGRTHCCQVSFFTSLSGSRWNLEDSERLSFDQMFKYLIKHCQGSCSETTTYAVLLVDNWDDDIARFWDLNIQRLKQKGVTIEVRMMIGSRPNVYEL
jgi:hypothetical protein